jgi:hypothetical protein
MMLNFFGTSMRFTKRKGRNGGGGMEAYYRPHYLGCGPLDDYGGMHGAE